MQANAVLEKQYTNSPQFESLVRERDPEKAKTVSADLIPKDMIDKFNVKAVLEKRKGKDFRKVFNFTNPNTLYAEVIGDSRGGLLPNINVMSNVNNYYLDKIDGNLQAIYKFSSAFYHETFFQNNRQQPDQKAFHDYEKYIYLLSLIVYVNKNKEALRGDLAAEADPIIRWTTLREDESFAWILEGPSQSFLMPKNFREQYASIISPAVHIDNILEQNKLAKMNVMYGELTDLKDVTVSRPNVFEKTLDKARQYFIVVRDEDGLGYENDENGNLIFDATYIDLGDTSNNVTVAQYNEIKVDQNKYKSPPSRMTFKAIQQLFTTFNSISIKEFTLDYSLYVTDLSKFQTVYLVFPGIQTSEHTVIGNIPRGTLYIAGHFLDDKLRRCFCFIPNEEITTFDGSQTTVKNMQFYLTTSISGTNSIVANKVAINFTSADVFNHLIKTNIDSSSLVPVNGGTLVVRTDRIEYAIPTDINELQLSDLPLLKSMVSKLTYMPWLVKEYLNNIDVVLARYKELAGDIVAVSNTEFNNVTSESLIGSRRGGSFTELKAIENEFNSIMSLLKRVNDDLQAYRVVSLRQTQPTALVTAVSSLSNNEAYQQVAKGASTASIDVVRAFFSQLCSLRYDELVPTTDVSKEKYIEIFNKILDLIFGERVTDLPRLITINVDVLHGGKIDDLRFHYDSVEQSLTFVMRDTDADAQYDFVSDDDNDAVLIRFYDNNDEMDQSAAFINAMKKKLIQRLTVSPQTAENIIQLPIYDNKYSIKRLITQDKDGLYYRSSRFENVNIEDVTADSNYYADITELIDAYKAYSFTAEDAIRTLSVVRYLPEQFMNKNLFTKPIFEFKCNEQDAEPFTVTVSASRELSLITGFDIEREILGYGEVIERTINHPDHGFKATISPSKDFLFQVKLERLNGEGYDIVFDIDLNRKVRRIDINSFRIYDEGEYIMNGSPAMRIRLDDGRYSVAVDDEYKDYSCTLNGINNIDFTSPDIIDAFYQDNMFKCYGCNDNMINRYWTKDLFTLSLMLTPLYETGTQSPVPDEISEVASASTIIYTLNNGNRQMHTLLYRPLGLESGVLLDNVYVQKAEAYVASVDDVDYSLSTEESITVINNEAGFDVWKDGDINNESKRVVIYFDSTPNHCYIREIDIDRKYKLIGTFYSDTAYAFTADAQLSVSVSFTNDEEMITITGLHIYANTYNLYKYTIDGSDIKKELLPHFYLNKENASAKLSDTTEVWDPISLSIVPSLNYHKLLPIFKYHQNNYSSDLYNNEGLVQMTISNANTNSNHALGTVQKHRNLEQDNKQDMNIAETIAYNSRHLIENVNGKSIITVIKNEDEHDAMTANSGVLMLNDNDLLYLSMNVK